MNEGRPGGRSVHLTYDERNEHNRDAARMFQYIDVRRFLARLREAIKAEGLDPRIRFLCAGEQGDRTGRVHWHMIIYSQVDLTQIGEFKRLWNGKRVVTRNRAEMITRPGGRKIRLNWSLWDHGFTLLQEPDAGGMHYVLSYCLKDQFTEEKSHETKRQSKVENFATGLFRMSKRPAIGEAWLWQKWQSLEEKGAVLPKLQFKVPGLHGYYIPSGNFRKKCLWSLVALNKRHQWTHGADAPQWSSLLGSLQDLETDMEILLGPQQEPDPDHPDKHIHLAQAEFNEARAAREFRRTCGKSRPCQTCLDAATVDDLALVGVERYYERQGGAFAILYRNVPGSEETHSIGTANPLCLKRSSQLARRAFPTLQAAGSAGR